MNRTPQEIARMIADDLFANGAGELAERLVLTVDGPPKRNLGGWSKAAVITRITSLLLGEQAPK